MKVNFISYFKERLRFSLHNAKSTRNLLKKDTLSEKEFEQLFTRMTHLECVQMQLKLMDRHPILVNKIIYDFQRKYSHVSIPKEFDSNRLLQKILMERNRK